MRTSILLFTALTLLAGSLHAQRMGHSNTDAPTVTQALRFGDAVSLELQYTSITWAGGQWAKALADEGTRDRIRDRINAAATEEPLGSLKASADVTLAGKPMAAGEYALAFVIGDDYRWQLLLTRGEQRVAWSLDLRPTDLKHDRLFVALVAGNDPMTAGIDVAFGDQVGRVAAIGAAAGTVAERKPVDRPKGEPLPGFVNAVCPLMDEPVLAEFFTIYKGKKIGFCCEDCLPEWRDLPDEDKERIFKKLVK